MPYSNTLGQLVDAVRTKGDYANSAVFTDLDLVEYINEAIAELYEIVTDQFQGYYEKIATITTTANVQTVSLPSDFLDLRALDRQFDATHHSPLRRINLSQSYSFQGTGQPQAYSLHGGVAPGTVRLYPVPDGVYTLRVTYDPAFTLLVDDSDTFEFRNGWEEYVHQAALLRCDAREERPLGDRLALIERAKQRIIGSAAKRNSAEPEYLTDWDGTPSPTEWIL